MKSFTLLPIMAIFLIAMSVGDQLESLPYLMKTIPAFILIVISEIIIIKKMKKAKKIQ